tara:strand:- start:113 stop:1054 length:942 start_codon:yes stop_codon:yes gene_type:complete
LKTSPEIIITNDDFKPGRCPVFITGNDETYIKKVEEFFIQKYIENGFSNFNKLEKINDYKESSSLFDEKLVNILYGVANIGEHEIDLMTENGDFLIISAKTNPKDKKLKKIFKDKGEYLLVECYKLNRQSKSKILNNFFDKKEIKLEKEIYWYLLENLDDRYAFLSEELEKVYLSGSGLGDINFLKKLLVSNGGEDMQKIFFSIYEKNDKLLKIYNSCIFSSPNLYTYIARLKFFINIINESNNSVEALSKFPRYLFAEKDIFLKIYKSINLSKKILINRLLFKTEKLTRIYPEHYHSIGLRLTFNLKKIITS